jgi:hypothetical protein
MCINSWLKFLSSNGEGAHMSFLEWGEPASEGLEGRFAYEGIGGPSASRPVGTDAVFILASIPWLNEIAFPHSGTALWIPRRSLTSKRGDCVHGADYDFDARPGRSSLR